MKCLLSTLATTMTLSMLLMLLFLTMTSFAQNSTTNSTTNVTDITANNITQVEQNASATIITTVTNKPTAANDCDPYEKGQCRNGGVCMLDERTKRPKCACVNLFSGDFCEKQPCADYCRNYGICQVIDTSKSNTEVNIASGDSLNNTINGTSSLELRCTCTDDRFTGHVCQFDRCKNETASCAAKDCYVLYVNGTCKCSCGADCARDYCNSHGKCKYFVNRTRRLGCMCAAGFSGPRCKIEATCKDYCLNNGKCKLVTNDSGSSPICDCPKGFNGTKCEQNLKTPTSSSSSSPSKTSTDETAPKKGGSVLRSMTYTLLFAFTLCMITVTVYYMHQHGLLNQLSGHTGELWQRLRSRGHTLRTNAGEMISRDIGLRAHANFTKLHEEDETPIVNDAFDH